MKIALVHYHLEPGGVTRVIENTVQAWEKTGIGPDQYTVLCGRPYSGGRLDHVEVVEGLDYADVKDAPDSSLLRQRMEEAALSALGQLPDLWHIHNHSLGKNPALSAAVADLAKSGARLLLQPHDFAEDGRPQNFSNLSAALPTLYPTAGQIHYAVLNRRDEFFLRSTIGELNSSVHLLANAIPEPPIASQVSSMRPCSTIPENLLLYPVRAVRRKNLGELALLAATHPEFHFANSLGPTNPSFLPIYQDWIEYAEHNQLRIIYGLGENTKATFHELIDHAQSMINVSVAEGFGLGFLEPWTFGKSLCGRNISEITSDFSELGVSLDHLYDELWIDSSLVNEDSLRQSVSDALNIGYHNYRRNMPADSVDRAIKSIQTSLGVKFGSLNEDLQKNAILKVQSSKYETSSIREQARIGMVDNQKIKQNQSAVKKNFSLSAYGEKVFRIYRDVLNSPTSKIIFADNEILLNQFLKPERLNLLRT